MVRLMFMLRAACCDLGGHAKQMICQFCTYLFYCIVFLYIYMNGLIYTGASVFEGLLWYRAGGPPACGIFYFMQPSQLDKIWYNSKNTTKRSWTYIKDCKAKNKNQHHVVWYNSRCVMATQVTPVTLLPVMAMVMATAAAPATPLRP